MPWQRLSYCPVQSLPIQAVNQNPTIAILGTVDVGDYPPPGGYICALPKSKIANYTLRKNPVFIPLGDCRRAKIPIQ